MVDVVITKTEEQMLSKAERIILSMILEQINTLRALHSLPQITRAQAIARFKELMRTIS